LLADGGAPVSAIVVDREPTRAARFAAAELRYHIEKISGAALPVVTDPADAAGGVCLFVGESDATRAMGLRSADFAPQEYYVGRREGGLVLMGMPRKKNLLDLLDLSSNVLSRLTLMLVRLSPIGIFALTAKAAGTLRLEDIGRIEVYLSGFLLMAVLLFFLILPLALTAFTPFSYREVMRESRAAMLTVLLTGNLFIVLPLLVENIETLFRRHRILNAECEAVTRIIVPITFIVPCAGQLMDLFFILFAGWFSHDSFGIGGYFQLYGAGLLTSFGSAKVAIPFLLGLFHLPSDLFDLFLCPSVITDNVKFMVEAAAILACSALFSAWMTGHVSCRWRRLGPRLLLIVLVTPASILALRWALANWLPQPEGQRSVLNAMKVEPLLPLKVFDRLPAASGDAKHYAGALDRIQATGVLRV
ncbi:MAG: dicarboxylate/amino acid:cation symporter, partial [Opitutae bacterium]|nr:dicarboxylate/amino acid:cation symporter [Opitutae bacterium]